MAKLLIVIGMIGFICLAIPTFILVAWNWNEKLYGPLFAIALLSISTTGSTVLVMLKPARINTKLVTSINFNMNENLPVRNIPLPQENMKAHKRLSEIANLSYSLGSKEKDKIIVEKPEKDEITIYCLELLQYMIIKDIFDLQKEGWSVGGYVGIGTQGNWVSDTNIATPVKVTKSKEIAGAALLKIISLNRFSEAFGEKFYWENISFPFPKKTKLLISSSPVSQSQAQSVSKQCSVQLIKPNYFAIDIRIKPLVSGSYPATLPKGIYISPEKVKNYRTFTFSIEMDARFNRFTAGNWQTEEYKAWVNWMFSEINRKYAISESSSP